MTSNVGSHIINEKLHGTGKPDEKTVEQVRHEVLMLLKQQMRPEFLNRIDEIIMFDPLSEENIKDIVRMQLIDVSKKLESSGIQIHFTDAATSHLASVGYDPQYGARPVKRVIQRQILNELSKMILTESIDKTQPITVDYEGKGLVFEN
jgi:ATP-dependent Clp protease ATP-binding subunit ClpB